MIYYTGNPEIRGLERRVRQHRAEVLKGMLRRAGRALIPGGRRPAGRVRHDQTRTA